MRSGLGSLYLRFDPEDGSAELRGQEPTPGLRCVIETRAERSGKMIFVLRRPGHSYQSLDRSSYAPARFEVYEDAYEETAYGREEREADRPWILVEKVVDIPIMVGTRAEFR